MGSERHHSLLAKLVAHVETCDWYWGDLEWKDAKKMLISCPPGTYLLRDSRSQSSIFSFSYRTAEKVLHSRADELLLKAAKEVSDGCYSPFTAFEKMVKRCNGRDLEMLLYQKDHIFANTNFALTTPLRKRDCVPSLQFLTRKVIREDLNFLYSAPLLPLQMAEYVWHSKPLNPPIDECIKVLQLRAAAR